MSARVIRVAAIGDLHVDLANARAWRRALEPCSRDADLLLLAGDLTETGTPAQAKRLASALEPIEIPIVAVLGNHDYHSNASAELTEILRRQGIHVLDGQSVLIERGPTRVGVAGVKGFGGGFAGACGSEFGEAEMKAFLQVTQHAAMGLRHALLQLEQNRAEHRVALLHYAPIPGTVRGERLEIFPFLGSQLLEAAIDDCGADLVVHGHAHRGTERGRTARGAPVRNVARPVIRAPYRVYALPGARRRPIHARIDRRTQIKLAPEEASH
jgi:Icc-related predicted phosphoesterase